jgi:hypothetical protein
MASLVEMGAVRHFLASYRAIRGPEPNMLSDRDLPAERSTTHDATSLSSVRSMRSAALIATSLWGNEPCAWRGTKQARSRG